VYLRNARPVAIHEELLDDIRAVDHADQFRHISRAGDTRLNHIVRCHR
jgi:hypothetical protein